MSLRALLVAVFLIAGLGSQEASAQYFRNNGIAFHAGWKGLGSTFDGLTGLVLWNVTDQVTIGAGYHTTIGYNLWLDILKVEIGGGAERLVEERAAAPIFSLGVSPIGVRYFFLEERFRPYVGAHVQYFQLIPVAADAPVPKNAFTANQPFWVGVTAGGGIEYYFFDEVSFSAHLDLAAYTGFNEPPPGGTQTFVLPAASGGITANIYF